MGCEFAWLMAGGHAPYHAQYSGWSDRQGFCGLEVSNGAMSMRLDGPVWLVRAVGRLCLCAGQVQRAEAVFRWLLQAHPRDVDAQRSLAHLWAQQGRIDLAIEAYRALLMQQPDLPEAWFNLAYLLEQTRRDWESAAAFEQAVRWQPRLDQAWYGWGLVLMRLQRYDDALVAFERNTRLQPMSPHGWVQLARVHLARHNPAEARAIVAHLRSFEPQGAAQLAAEIEAHEAVVG